MLIDFYRKMIYALGLYALLAFALEAMGILSPGFSLLDPIAAFVGIFLGWRLSLENIPSPVEKSAAVLPWTLFLYHISSPLGSSSLGTAFSIFGVSGLTMAMFILLGKTRPRKEEIKTIDEEAGDYPVYLNDHNFIPTQQVLEHVHVMGAAEGITASYFHNAQWQSIGQGKGSLHLDLKSEELDLVAFYAQHHGRKKDLVVLDLLRPERSLRINPLAWFKLNEKGEKAPDSQRISEIVETSVYFGIEANKDDAHGSGKRFLKNFTKLFLRKFPIITYQDLYYLVAHEMERLDSLKALCDEFPDTSEALYLKNNIIDISLSDRRRNLGGLCSLLSSFVKGPYAPLMNTQTPDILMADILSDSKIFYLGVASLVYPAHYQKVWVAYVKAILSEAEKRAEIKVPFDIFMADAHQVVYSGFVEDIERIRGKGVSCHLGHPSLGILSKVTGESFDSAIFDNRTAKIVFQVKARDVAESFARLFEREETDILSLGPTRTRKSFLGTHSGEEMKKNGSPDRSFDINEDKLMSLSKGKAAVWLVHGNSIQKGIIGFPLFPEPPSSFDATLVVPELGYDRGPVESSLPLKPNSAVEESFFNAKMEISKTESMA